MSTTMLLENEKGQRLLTARDVAELPTQLPSGPVEYELHKGVLVIMAPPGDPHGASQTKFSGYLLFLGELAGHGRVRSGSTLLLSQNPDDVIVPEAYFLTNDQLPYSQSPEAYVTTIPALVVEVRSKNDWRPEMTAKIKKYLDAGVRVVWFADPYKEVIEIHRQNKPVITLTSTDTLTAEGVIPNFAVPVARFFDL